MNKLSIKDFLIGEDEPLTIISGPCVIESEEHTLMCAETLKKILRSYGFSFIFKASYDKANRSSKTSFRGPGLEKGLKILEKVKKELDLPIVTDVHCPEQAKEVADVCDMLQIPAFLCRQTDLVLACAQTNRPINVKKGQFMAPWDMKNVIEKIESQNNQNILLTDRGTCFGYNHLVSDMRAIAIMQKLGYPVCFDASHSTQLPGSLGTSSGGQSEFIPLLSKAAFAAGCNAIFIETHPNPLLAMSDRATVLDYHIFEALLKDLQKLQYAKEKSFT